MDKSAAEYLFKVATLLSHTCPSASRIYMTNFQNRMHEFPDLLKNKKKLMHCHCGAIFSSENCQIRSKACQPLNSKIKKLMKIERNQPWKLDSQQKKKLRRFYNSSSKIVYKCLICKKTTSFSGSKTNRTSLSTKISTTSTSIPKLKLNKSDNAGLFITLPNISRGNEK